MYKCEIAHQYAPDPLSNLTLMLILRELRTLCIAMCWKHRIVVNVSKADHERYYLRWPTEQLSNGSACSTCMHSTASKQLDQRVSGRSMQGQEVRHRIGGAQKAARPSCHAILGIIIAFAILICMQ
jgi:hypothetical protein